MNENQDLPLSKQLFMIPNLMGYFRILLIPIFVCVYLNADTAADYRIAAALVALSGLTDMLDGKIARRFHMVTKLGKALDPLADKLTQAAMALCLVFHFKTMIFLLIVLIIKEGFMGIMGIIMLKKGRMLDGAMWFGKLCTAILYLIMFVLFLFPELPSVWASLLVTAGTCFLLFSFIMYIPVFVRMRQEIKKQQTNNDDGK